MKQHKQQFVKKKYLTPLFFCSKILKVEKVWQVIPMKMDKIYEQTMLFDFYGELLTEHQRRIYEDVVYNDLSLAEIAKENGISRQGVHDLVRRCDYSLKEYEDKLHLVERFLNMKSKVSSLEKIADDTTVTREELVLKVKALSRQILEEM